jgi:hypothetical protein
VKVPATMASAATILLCIRSDLSLELR